MELLGQSPSENYKLPLFLATAVVLFFRNTRFHPRVLYAAFTLVSVLLIMLYHQTGVAYPRGISSKYIYPLSPPIFDLRRLCNFQPSPKFHYLNFLSRVISGNKLFVVVFFTLSAYSKVLHELDQHLEIIYREYEPFNGLNADKTTDVLVNFLALQFKFVMQEASTYILCVLWFSSTKHYSLGYMCILSSTLGQVIQGRETSRDVRSNFSLQF